MTNLKQLFLITLFGCSPHFSRVDGNAVFRFHNGDIVIANSGGAMVGYENCISTVVSAHEYLEHGSLMYNLKIKCPNGVNVDYLIAERFIKLK